MESTYKKTRAPAEENAVRKSREQSRGRARFTPNSAMPGANTGGMGREALRQAMREKMTARFGAPYENGRAEAEADRLSAYGGVGGSQASVKAAMVAMGPKMSGSLYSLAASHV